MTRVKMLASSPKPLRGSHELVISSIKAAYVLKRRIAH